MPDLSRVARFCLHGAWLPYTRWLALTVCAATLGGVLPACGGTEPAAAASVADATVDAADTALQDAQVADVQADTSTPLDIAIDAAPPLPKLPPPPPTCTPTLPGLDKAFTLPQVPAPTGDVRLQLASPMTLIGAEERVEIRVLKSGEIDKTAKGVVTLQPDGGVQVKSVTAVANGVASAVIVAQAAGAHAITATLADGRSGTTNIFGYATQLPIWHIEMTEADWKALLVNTADGTIQSYPCTVTMDGQVHTGASIKLHGGTSLDAPKRSFRVDLAKDDKLADGRRKLILRGEYIDKSMLRTWLSYRALQELTWLSAPQTKFVHVRVNQQFYGAMNWVERIDDDYLARTGRDTKSALYEGDPPTELGNPGANLTALFPTDKYAQVYQKHSGQKAYDDLITFIEQVLLRSDAELFATLEAEAKVGDWLLYAAFNTVIQNIEHLRKNFYLYRDEHGADQRFEWLTWDTDMSWGHLWTEVGDAMDETIFVDSAPDKGRKEVDAKFYNQMYRALNNPAWKNQWQQHVLQLAAVLLDPAYYEPRLQWALCTFGPDIVNDPHKRAKNDEYLQRVDELRQYAKGRLQFLQQSLGGK